MRVSELLKRTGSNISYFCKRFFGDNPELYVEPTDDGALLAATVTDGDLSKAEAAELVKAFRDAEKSGKAHTKIIDSSIRLDSDENGYSTTSKAERETSYRDSEAIKELRDKRNDTSARDIPNIAREQGGEARSRGR